MNIRFIYLTDCVVLCVLGVRAARECVCASVCARGVYCASCSVRACARMSVCVSACERVCDVSVRMLCV